MNGKVLDEFEIRSGQLSGTRLLLYDDRLALESETSLEVLPLAGLVSVRIAFERDPGRLAWASALFIIAAVLAALSWPLQDWSAAAIARLGEPAKRESLDAVLGSLFAMLGVVARALPWIAGALALGGAASAALFWVGRTTLLVSPGALEREISVRGRDQDLARFADALAAQLLAARRLR